MPVTLEQFVKQLEESRILADETIREFIPPQASPKDAEELARELVRHKKLTKFQAEEVYRGKGKSLVLGNYVLREKIGAGGMGEVYKARHRRMDRLVAVKILPRTLTKDPAAIARFEREVKAAAMLRHPNIVAADDADCANGVHFLVMELVDGRDLAALVKRDGPFSMEKAIDCVLQAARGLDFAHQKGVVHRDIKPSNLLLDREGHIKILDMGLARLDHSAEGSPQETLTSTGIIMGTVDFMAPEQALDTRSADARADIYALGCTLFYLLTGRSVYTGDTVMKRLLAHRDEPIPSLSAFRPEVSPAIDEVFCKLLAKRPEERIQTMSELVSALTQAERAAPETITVQQSLDFNPSSRATAGANELAFSVSDLQFAPLERKASGQRNVAGALKRGAGRSRKNVRIIVGAASVGVVILTAAVAVALRNRNGTPVVHVDPSDGRTPSTSLEKAPELRPPGADSSGADEAAIDANTPLASETPGFNAWLKQVATLPATEQVEAVRRVLMDHNAEFDGNVRGFVAEPSPVIENGQVASMGICVDKVADISPLRAFQGLKRLQVYGSRPGASVMNDLSPLAGMGLTDLDCSYTYITDLSPLKGMPLANLNLRGAPLTNLTALREMRLVSLVISDTGVADLSPLTGMSLRSLWFGNTSISDLSPLAGMELIELNCRGSDVSDLSPLRGMPLEFLDVYAPSVSDISPLADCRRLKQLFLGNVADLSPLAGLRLELILCGDLSAEGAGVLRSMTTLKTINGQPAAEFWRTFDAERPPP